MAELQSYKSGGSGSALGTVKVNDAIFGTSLRLDILNEYVIMQRRAARQGTASTKTRAEVSGTGKKPFRQKGTGNARQGTLRGPHQYKGGVAFGPKPRKYSASMNRKVKKEAIRVALSQKAFEKKLVVVESLDIGSKKTKDALKWLGAWAQKSCVLVGELSGDAALAIRNLSHVSSVPASALNVMSLLKADTVVMTKAAVEWCEENLAPEAGTKEKAA